LCLALHFWRLDAAPSGFFVDEAGIGLAARGIALDGRDEHGAAWPLFFQAFGEWKNPVEIYMVAAAVRLFGPSVTIIRAVPTGLALLTAVVLGVIAWDLFRNRWLALGTFAVAALLPWLFSTGRLGFEAPAQPAALSIFLLLWLRAQRRHSYRYAAGAGVALAISGYAYSTGRLFMPLLVVALLLCAFPWEAAGRVVMCTVVASIGWLPALLFDQLHHHALTARFNTISVFTDARSPLDAVARIWRVYSSALSPQFLFQSAPFIQGGELFVTLVPMLLIGLAALWRHRRDPFWRLVAVGLVLAPVPAALTVDFGHQLRNLEAAPFWLLAALLGAHEAWLILGRRHAWVVAALVVALSLEAGGFMADYFSRYPDRIADWNDAGFDRAVAAAQQESGSAGASGRVVISDRIIGGDILYPWFAHEDLPDYRRAGLGALGAEYSHSLNGWPDGTVLVAGPDERPAGASPIRTILRAYDDDWGRHQARVVYRVWRVPSSR